MGCGEETGPESMKCGITKAELVRFNVAAMSGEKGISPSEGGEFGEDTVVDFGGVRVMREACVKIGREVSGVVVMHETVFGGGELISSQRNELEVVTGGPSLV